MERKEKIFEYIISEAYVPLKYDEMAIVLDVPEEDRGELSQILDTLVREGRVYKTKKGRYCPLENVGDVAAGILMCNAAGGFGFVRSGSETDEDIFIAHEKLNGALDGDTVLVHIEKKDNSHGHREGNIVRILNRGNERLVGVIIGTKHGKYRMAPDKRSIFAQVRIDEEALGGARIGDRVMCKITGYSSKNKPQGEVITVLGNSDSLMSCLNGLLASNDIPTEFPEQVILSADRLPDSVSEKEISRREDLRDKKIFTIDGDDSRDFDDAVSLEETENGNYLLGVHIADVTHYVHDGSALDKEALSRGTSVYFPHKVIPMLPKRLSNGICSLNPDVDRLTLSVFLEIDRGGNILTHRLCESVIHSCARMTYNDVNKILAGDTVLRRKYDFIVPILEQMSDLSEKMAVNRSDRGAIDFDFPEAKISCDSEGTPIEIKLDERGKSQRLIESFMLAANETIAESAYWAELPFVYRVHEAPSDDKISAFNNFIKDFGYSMKGKIDSESIHPKDIQKVLEEAEGSPEEMMISQLALRSLMKACYRDSNDGHFGLAARYYCHFTSPIRRYPDLMIHRILKDFINRRLDESKAAYYEKKVKTAAEQSSEREVIAEHAERDADDLLKTAYMQNMLGKSFDAVISSITSFGMFAQLGNTCEGLIRCENMTSDYFEYDEQHRMLIGKHSGRIYKIGDIVQIRIAACNLIMRKTDFVLEEDANNTVLARVEDRNRKLMRNPEKKLKKKKVYRRRKRVNER